MTLAIGSPYSNINGDDSGSVRTFHRDNGLDWKKLGETIIGEAPNDRMGWSVALSANGMTLAVGVIWNSRYAKYSGQVKVHTWVGDTSSWELDYTVHGGLSYDTMSTSMSLSADGKTLAVGAPYSDRKADNSGYVGVFHESDDSIWNDFGRVIYGDVAFDELGSSVSLSRDGKTLAIGAWGNDGNGEDSGQVRVYQWADDNGKSNWKQQGQIINSEVAGDSSGSSVSLSSDGKTLAIGAPSNSRNGEYAGHVQVYGWDDDWSSWEQLGQSINGEVAGDNSGWPVCLSADGKTLAIGARWNGGNGKKSGCVRIYHWDEATFNYEKLAQDIVGDAAGDNFGVAVALSADGKTVAIGAEEHDGSGVDSGQVKVFRVEY